MKLTDADLAALADLSSKVVGDRYENMKGECKNMKGECENMKGECENMKDECENV